MILTITHIESKELKLCAHLSYRALSIMLSLFMSICVEDRLSVWLVPACRYSNDQVS